MKIQRGLAVVAMKVIAQQYEQQRRKALIKFTSHNGQALTLEFDDGSDVIVFQDDDGAWQDPTGAFWQLEFASAADASSKARKPDITAGGRDRSGYATDWRSEERHGMNRARQSVTRWYRSH